MSRDEEKYFENIDQFKMIGLPGAWKENRYMVKSFFSLPLVYLAGTSIRMKTNTRCNAPLSETPASLRLPACQQQCILPNVYAFQT